MSHPAIKPKIIGLTGLAGTGKDTVRSILERRHGYIGVAFADPIRNMLYSLLIEAAADVSYMHDRQLKELPIPGLGVSYRHLAQTLGTEWGRSVSGDLWLSITRERVKNHFDHHQGRPVVISDVRFQNEAEWIMEAGGEIWRIEREEAEPVRGHVSENIAALPHFCRVIENHGDIDDLTAFVTAVMWDRRAAA